MKEDETELAGQNLHVYPIFPGQPKHEMSVKCWCEPQRDQIVPTVIVHRLVH